LSGAQADGTAYGDNQFGYLPPLTNVSPPHFVRIENELFGEKIDSDYLNEVLERTNHRVLRFKNMPIPVYITPPPDPGFANACIEGFEAWENKTAGMIRFVQVPMPEQARIQVVWEHLGLTSDNGQGALGANTTVRWKMDGAGLLRVGGIPLPVPTAHYKVPPQTIEVNIDVLNMRDLETRPILLRNIVTHELGHALGLIGHSSDRCDIMYADSDEYSRLSQRDINTLMRLYRLKPDVAL
jgi:hypothetical protein